ncbi:MAG: outer membrane protein assembly factor BamD, partial [Planctomycetales bacterium]|nr:outer membrane protein assembly factor BamD [Planctomycetales bacterium]
MFFARVAPLVVLTLVSAGCTMMRTRDNPLTLEDESARDNSTLHSLRNRGVRSTVAQALGQGPDQDVARSLYAEADALFEQAAAETDDRRHELFKDASAKYAQAAARWPDSMLQEDALYMSGESLFFADEYKLSREAFDKLIKDYPNTRHIDRIDARRFDIAQYWLAVHRSDPKFFLSPNMRDDKLPRNDTFGHAMKVFDKVRLDNPSGRLADDATMAAGSAYFAKGDFRNADRMFTDLRRTYPESPHMFEATLLSVKSKIQLYQGADYDSQHLEQSQDMIRMLLEQFPEESGEHREYLENAYKEVRLKLATRDWDTAKFFDNRGEYGGARYYYSKV